MLKKLLLLTLFTFAMVVPVSATTTQSSGVELVPEKIMPPIVDPINSLQLPIFGEDHAYSIVFRGNNEAIVNMRVGMSNFGEAPKKDFVLGIPYGQPSGLVVFQIIREPTCYQYEYSDPSVTSHQPRCLKYQEPDYYSPWWEKSRHLLAKASIDGSTIHIELPEAIEPSKSGGYVLFMKMTGLTKPVFGGSHQYRFESLKSDAPIRNIAVSMSTDTEMVFKGAQSQVIYQIDSSTQLIQAAISSRKNSFTSKDFDNYVNQIGQGQYYKYSSNLSPGDTFIVEGKYARTLMSLYSKEAVQILGIVIGIFGLALIGVSIYSRNSRSKDEETQKPISRSWALVYAISASFLSAMLIAGFTAMLALIIKKLESNLIYGSGNMLNMLLISIFSLGVYATLVFVPAIIAGVKKGLWWGIGVFAMTIFWVVIFIVVIGGFFYFLNSSQNIRQYDDTPVPMMKGEFNEVAPGIISPTFGQ